MKTKKQKRVSNNYMKLSNIAVSKLTHRKISLFEMISVVITVPSNASSLGPAEI